MCMCMCMCMCMPLSLSMPVSMSVSAYVYVYVSVSVSVAVSVSVSISLLLSLSLSAHPKSYIKALTNVLVKEGTINIHTRPQPLASTQVPLPSRASVDGLFRQAMALDRRPLLLRK